MSNSVGQVDLDLGLNYNAFQKQLSGISGTATNMVGGAFKRLGVVIAGAFAVGSIVNFGKEAINLASDLQEVQNVVDVTFGSMSTEIDAWSTQMLESFGLSELSAKQYASTMGAMLKSSGLAGTQMKDMSKNLTELAADMASFYNLGTDEAYYKVFAGMTGETEPLKALGVNMNVANMEAYALSQGIAKSYQAMSQAEQTMLRYNYLLSVTGDAQSDFARNGDSWANQIRVLTEQWKIFQGTMGQGFINILTPIIKWINALIQRLQVAAQYFRALTEVLFGAQKVAADGSAAATNAASSMGSIGDESAKAAKGIKKAAKAASGLTALDQFNLIKTTKDAASDAAGIANALGGMGAGSMSLGDLPTPDVNTDVFREKMQSLVDTVKQQFGGLWDNLKLGWGGAVQSFGPTLAAAWGMVAPEIAGWKTSFQTVFLDIMSLGTPLQDWVMTSLVPAWQTGILTAVSIVSGLYESVRMVFDSIWSAVFPIIQLFVTEGLPRLTEFVVGAMGIFQSLFDLAKEIFDSIWRDAVDPALQLVSKIVKDVLDIIFGWWDTWGKDIMAGLKTVLDNIKMLWKSMWENFLKPFIDNMLNMLTWLWEKHLKGLVKEIGTFVGKLVTAALDIYNKFIVPIGNYLIKTLGPTFSNIFSFIGDVVGTAIGIISDVIKGLLRTLGGVIDFIAGVFTGDWEKAWNGIQDFMGGFGDALVGIFKGAVNLIIDALNFMVRQINKVKIDVPAWVGKIPGVPDGITSVGFNIPEIPKLAKGGLAYGPTLAMVGDNRGASVDPEVVSPLSKLQDMLAGTNAVTDALLMSMLEVLQDIAKKDTTVKIGETELGRAAAKGQNTLARQSGRPALSI